MNVVVEELIVMEGNVFSVMVLGFAIVVMAAAHRIVSIAIKQDSLFVETVLAVETANVAVVREESHAVDVKERAFTNNTLNTRRTIA